MVKRASEDLPSSEEWAAVKREPVEVGLGRYTAVLPEALRQAIIAAARAGLPNESCGLLVSDRPFARTGVPKRYVPLRNAAGSPYRYLIDPQEQLQAFTDIDDRDEVLWAIVHSHVASPAMPSATDIGLAFYPESLYVIVSLADANSPAVRAWSVRDGAVSEVALAVTD